MIITDKILEPGEYYNEIFEKNTIYIHHTAGSHRPDFTIDGWEKDRAKNGGQLPVGTAYVIGGISTTDNNAYFDGSIFRAFDDKYWAHHLGTKEVNNKLLNQQSIGIEICSYGPLTKTKDGFFLNYVNKQVPSTMVAELPVPYRGFKYYQKYTDKQLSVLKELILDIAARHPKIDLKGGLQQFISQGASALELNQGALKGVPGIWSHSNVRKDKFDVFPQPQLIELIKQF
jgi:N-acetylmuramoyl-L-alanine amidase